MNTRIKGFTPGTPNKAEKLFSRLLLALLLAFAQVAPANAMSRTLQEQPAIVIAAFGTTTKAQATYDFFAEQLAQELPERYKKLKISWAFTSEIVRERANAAFKKEGSGQRYYSLPQVLANLEDEGYRRLAIQPLHIAPGQEYIELEKVVAAFRQLDLQITVGETLLHKWEGVFETIHDLEGDFLPPETGANILIIHGSPQTAPGSNSTYLGLERYLKSNYPNVFAAGIDGILTRAQALDQAKRYPQKRVKLIPFMYVGGDHIMNDIMGEGKGGKDSTSWAAELAAAGLAVETPYREYKGARYYQGLGFNAAINRRFIEQLVTALDKLGR